MSKQNETSDNQEQGNSSLGVVRESLELECLTIEPLNDRDICWVHSITTSSILYRDELIELKNWIEVQLDSL